MRKISRRGVLLAAASAGVYANGAQAQSAAPDVLGVDDAVGVAARVRRREITAAEALEAAIARAERVNPQLNFIASSAYPYGRARAAQRLSGPFAGVPTLIKDLANVTGLPTHFGSRAFANFVASEQTPYVDSLLAGGVVPFGKSTTPEFGFTATTEPLLGGPTRNPWNTDHSSGGSSGGAAVAVAARVVPIAHATDGGGSIRIPASCNGLVGLKPSRGRTVIAYSSPVPLQISVAGCVSLSVRDTAAWLAMTEQSGRGAELRPVGLVTGPSRRRLRIMVSLRGANGHEPDSQVRAAIEAAAELCRGLGHHVAEGVLDLDTAQFSADFTLYWAAGAAQVVQEVQSRAGSTPLDQLLEPLTLDLAAHAGRAGQEAIGAAIERLRAVEAQYEAAFLDIDVLLTPVLGKPPLRLGEIAPNLGMETGFARVLEYVAYTPLQNAAGAPAISLPLGWSSDGLPIGAHFSAPLGQERRLLQLAYELEQAQPWSNRRPGVCAI